MLIVDDDALIRQLLEAYLKEEGYVVRGASGGKEGLRLAREVRPALITLDVFMPDLDGWAVLAALKEDPATRDIPVLLLTLAEDERRGFALGATDFLGKPIDWDRLGRLLRRHAGPQSTVLIVEDDPALRGLLREELTLGGWRVVEAGDGREGLARFEEQRPALILLDLMMPILDGFAFLEELRARPEGRQVPVVVLTARELTEEDRRRLSGSVAQVLGKHDLSGAEIRALVRDRLAAVCGFASGSTRNKEGGDGEHPAGRG